MIDAALTDLSREKAAQLQAVLRLPRVHRPCDRSHSVAAIGCALALALGCSASPGQPSAADASIGDARVDSAGQDAPLAIDAQITGDAAMGDAPTDAPHGEVSTGRLALGGYHSCLVDDAGVARCWGRNSDGELGDGSTTHRATPTTVLGGPYLSLSAGNYHTCAITAARRVQCWGRNLDRQLGDGTTTDRTMPTPVVGLPDADVTELSAAGGDTCALINGEIWCWGDNSFGQLGDGTTTARTVPVKVTGITDATSVAMSGFHGCATRASGAAVCWGWTYNGRLGNGESSPSVVRSSPVTLSLVAAAARVDVGGAFSCVRLATGRIQCWGDNQYGQLGNGSQVYASEPILVTGIDDVVQLVTADAATCVRDTDHVVKCWGRNRSGQIGNGSGGVGAFVLVPSVVMGLTGPLDDLASGFTHSCALSPDGSVRCWGGNTYGQIGDGSINTDRFTATQVAL